MSHEATQGEARLATRLYLTSLPGQIQMSSLQDRWHCGMLGWYLEIFSYSVILNSLLGQKGQFTHQPCPRKWFVRQIFDYSPKNKTGKNENSL